MQLSLDAKAEDVNAATAALAEELRGFAARVEALSGPIADTGVSALPLAAAPLLGGAATAQAAAAPTPQQPAAAASASYAASAMQQLSPEAATPAAPAAAPHWQSQPDGLGVRITSRSPPQDVTVRTPAERGALRSDA